MSAAAVPLAAPICAGNRICNVCRRFFDVCAREHIVQPNTLELAANLAFWLEEEATAQSGDEHFSNRERIRIARAELSGALLADLKTPIAATLKRRRESET